MFIGFFENKFLERNMVEFFIFSQTLVLLKNLEQFEAHGCQNCESFLHMKSSRERVYEYTSANWSGMIAIRTFQNHTKFRFVKILKKAIVDA